MATYRYYLAVRGVGDLHSNTVVELVWYFALFRLRVWRSGEKWLPNGREYTFLLYTPVGTFFSSTFVGTLVMLLSEKWQRRR